MNPKVKAALDQCLERYPGQRTGQLLVNAIQRGLGTSNEDLHQVLFYINEEALSRALFEYAYQEA